ncbi:MAG: IS110 family transposase [Actinobacteria bacterium]|nr:IS110 family transposase [Actinomycetota bacterium]
MRRVIGIDLAITAESRACVADATGGLLAERGFRMRRHELEALFEAATNGMAEGDELLVVMEPTSSMWIAPTAFFGSKGARVHLVPPEQSADLRRYYTKHVKNDRIDAKLLARLPLLHPEGLHEAQVPAGSQGVLKRIVRRRARLVSELAQHRQRVRSTLHHAMPGMNDVLGEQLGKAAMALLGRYGSPKAMLRLGRARISALFVKHSRGAWREAKADQVLAVARSAIELWDGLEGCDFDEIAEDLACEARIIKTLETEIGELDARAAGLLGEIDPQGLFMSMPGFGERTATTVAGRLGDASRFRNAAAIRAFIGMIPGTDQSGEAEARPRLTKSGDRLLRTALFLAADTARKEDPQLAEIYLRQLNKGSHHTKALCAVATALASRLAAVLREGRPYELRAADGTMVDTEIAKQIIKERFKVSAELRMARRQVTRAKRQKGRHLDGIRSKDMPSPPAEMAPDKDAIPAARSA